MERKLKLLGKKLGKGILVRQAFTIEPRRLHRYMEMFSAILHAIDDTSVVNIIKATPWKWH